MISLKDKKAIEMGFNWIFAIIAGAFILFLALYISGVIIKTGETSHNTEIAATFTSLTDALETGLASGTSYPIKFNKEAKITYTCEEDTNPPFGMMRVEFNEKTLGTKYSEKGFSTPITDKYIFVEDEMETKSLFFFAKPFFLSFKVADIIVFIDRDYCFLNSPREVEDEIINLGISYFTFTEDPKNCSKKTKICFERDSGKCDIIVIGNCLDDSCESAYDYGKIIKNNKQMYYSGNLLFGALFSSPDIYECNVKRMISKFNMLSGVYLDKVNIIQRKGCEPKLQYKLSIMKDSAAKFNSSKSLFLLYNDAREIEMINDEANTGCRLY